MFNWYSYLKSHRQNFCTSNDSLITIDYVQQRRDKEVLRVDIGDQKLKVVRYIDSDNERFNAYTFHIGLPLIPKRFLPIWVDEINRVVVLRWEAGKMIFAFDDVNVSSRITKETWYSVGELFASVHRNSFNKFSYVEMEPSLSKSFSLRYLFGSHGEFRNFVIYSFVDATFKSIHNAIIRRIISSQETVIIRRKCEEILEWLLQGNSKILETVNTFSILHGDVTPENIIIHQDSSVTLIDWEYWYFGDPAMDIAFLFEQMDQVDADGHLDVWKGYCENETLEVLGDPVCFIERVNLYKRIILGKFTVLVANGLCSSDSNEINQPLFDHLYKRLESEDWREIKCL